MSEGFKLNREINVLSLIALVLSVLGILWQMHLAFIGSDISQLSYNNRVAEFRCSSTVSKSHRKACWDGSGSSSLSVILPVFFSNLGASGYSDAVVSVDLVVRIYGAKDKDTFEYKMIANNFWYGTQNGSSSSKPFKPIVIDSRTAHGEELRFVGAGEAKRITWKEFSERIISDNVRKIKLTTTTHFSIESLSIMKSCDIRISNRLVDVLQRKKKGSETNDVGPRLTLTCAD